MAHDLTPHDIRRISALSGCDPRTVRRLLTGERIRPTNRARIVRALAALDWLDLLPAGTPVPYTVAREVAR